MATFFRYVHLVWPHFSDMCTWCGHIFTGVATFFRYVHLVWPHFQICAPGVATFSDMCTWCGHIFQICAPGVATFLLVWPHFQICAPGVAIFLLVLPHFSDMCTWCGHIKLCIWHKERTFLWHVFRTCAPYGFFHSLSTVVYYRLAYKNPIVQKRLHPRSAQNIRLILNTVSEECTVNRCQVSKVQFQTLLYIR